MGLIAAIVGLAVLMMIHEAGHFFAARAVGMTPRKFYIGFGPPIVEADARQASSTASASIPLGGYVKIPGMNRPSPGDLRRALRPEERERLRPELDALDAAIERERLGGRATPSCQALRPALGDNADVAGARVVARARRVLAPGDVAAHGRDLRRAGRRTSSSRSCSSRRSS